MAPKSKYEPLFEYLRQQPDAGLLELTFEEIETVLNGTLPASAGNMRAWWANSSTAQSQAWQKAGWLVDDVDFENRAVIFRPARITYRVSPIRKSQGWTGQDIKALREFAGWSQQELADRLAVRQQTVSDWEIGNHTARRSMSKLLQMIAREVGFPYRTDKGGGQPPGSNEE
jgi:DNA-binding XRE family transcriptional regulator